MRPSCAVVILAAGNGVKFGAKKPKQFHSLKGTPLICHAITPFARIKMEVAVIIVVVPAAHKTEVERLVRRYFPRENRVRIITGGKTRFESYMHATRLISAEYKSLPTTIVHDAVRIMITDDDVRALHKDFLHSKADASLVVRLLPESLLVMRSDKTLKCLDRDPYVLGQSPNFFKTKLLCSLLKRYSRLHARDSLDVLEVLSRTRGVKIVGSRLQHPNIKITYPEDLRAVALLLGK